MPLLRIRSISHTVGPDSRDDSFYFKSLQKAPENPNAAWFFPKFVLGKNAFSTMVKTMFAEAGIEGKSNHSLRVAGATRLFSGDVPELYILVYFNSWLGKVVGHIA